MRIELRHITIRELVADYKDDGEDGVIGYGGRLDIRPPFQRNFIYKDKQRNAVIDTVTKGFPLNVMYWADRGDDTYEIIDGQQRTISIAEYTKKNFSLDGYYFHNLPADKKETILEYELTIYVCSGTDSEKLAWFETINIAGETLTDQELRNAVYSGPWISDAKRYFSKRNCPAYQIGQDYMKGSVNRQDYLETAIKWISQNHIVDYMGRHQHDADASELWEHFQSVIRWIERTFTFKRAIMKGVDWGSLHHSYKDASHNPAALEQEIRKLVADEDVERQSGIYSYVLTRDESHLKIRAFSQQIKQRVYERQNGMCRICGEHFDSSKMEADHIKPWAEDGKTVEENCQMLCKDCNRRKGAR